MIKKTPKHVAIIMDGNGRWAKSRLLPKISGHKKGAENAKKIILHAKKRKIQYLTLYTFSSENWGRSDHEVSDLMSLIKYYLSKEKKLLNQNNIKVKVIGNLAKISNKLRAEIDEVVALTKNNNDLILTIAFSYGSRDEIIDATKSIADLCIKNKLSIEDISTDLFSSKLYTRKIPDPDLLIRTSGEHRISNFLLWQLAYTELYFTNIHWPEFHEDEFDKAIEDFQKRDRRYGK